MTAASEANTWRTSVNELVQLFREALVALVPVLEAAHIPWRNQDAYDQWDAISHVLYDKLVAEPVAWALDAVGELRLAPYDTRVDDYSGVSFIEVLSDDLPADAMGAFFRFATDLQPFDVVDVVLLDSRQRPTAGLQRAPLQRCAFRMQHLTTEGRTPVEDMVVPK